MSNLYPDNLQYPHWQKPYLDAMMETNPEKLKERIATAESAILSRLRFLEGSTTNAHAERIAIDDALNGLRVLKQDKLTFPGVSAGNSLSR